MPLDGNAPQPGAEGAAAPEQVTVTDERSAADAIMRAGLLGDFADDAPPPPADELPATEAEDGPEETPATGEEEGQSDPPAEKPAVIEPPKSLTAEEREAFAKLPPEAQQMIVRREGDREKALFRQSEELAEQRKAAEAERASYQQQTTEYLTRLQQLATLAIPDMQEFQKLQDVDWVSQNPAEAVVLEAKLKSTQARIGAIQNEMTQLEQRRAAELDRQRAEFTAKQAEILKTKIPEFADDAKRGDLVSKIRADLVDRGFNDREIGQVSDARLVEIALDAMRWRQHQATLRSAQAKAATPPAPRVQKPGPAPDADAGSRTVRDQIQRFRQSGDIRDASKLLEHLF